MLELAWLKEQSRWHDKFGLQERHLAPHCNNFLLSKRTALNHSNTTVRPTYF